MRGVAERIKTREHLQRNPGVHVHRVACGKAQIFREGSLAVDPDALRVLAEVPPPGEAVAALAAHDVAFAVDQIARLEALDIAADLDNLADELVADHHRRFDGLLGPGVPVEDMDIGAANCGPLDFDEHVVDARSRHGHLDEFEACSGPDLGNRAHGFGGHEKVGFV